jgi:hypothetical protein
MQSEYPTTPTQVKTMQRHVIKRRNKPPTEADKERIRAAQLKRERRGRAAD